MHITNNRVSIRTHLPVEAGGDLGRVEMSGFGLFCKRLQEVHFRLAGLRLDAFGSASRRSGQYEKSFLSNYHSNLSLKFKKLIQNNHQILLLSIIINFNVLTSHTDLYLPNYHIYNHFVRMNKTLMKFNFLCEN